MINSISASAQVSQSPQQAATQPAVHHKHRPAEKQDTVQLSPEAQKAAEAAKNGGKE